MANITDGFSGAELENVVNLTALQTLRKARIQRKREVRIEAKEFRDFAVDFIKEQQERGTP